MKKLIIITASLLWLLTACTPESPAPAAAPEDIGQAVELPTAAAVAEEPATAEPITEEPSPEPPTPTAIPIDTTPTAEPQPTQEPEVAAEPEQEPEPEQDEMADSEDLAALVTAGRTEEGAWFIGNPDAEVTIIDYSDFL